LSAVPQHCSSDKQTSSGSLSFPLAWLWSSISEGTQKLNLSPLLSQASRMLLYLAGTASYCMILLSRMLLCKVSICITAFVQTDLNTLRRLSEGCIVHWVFRIGPLTKHSNYSDPVWSHTIWLCWIRRLEWRCGLRYVAQTLPMNEFHLLMSR